MRAQRPQPARVNRSHTQRSQHGQTLAVFALVLVAVVGFTALTIDVGLAYENKRSAQNGADAAALAGGDVLLEGGSGDDAEAAALQWAAQNGYDAVKVTASSPPQSGPYAGEPEFIEVVIADQTQAQFAKILGVELWKTSSRAVAGIHRTPGPYAIIVLNETECQAFEVNGQVTIEVNGAGTLTNSACETSALYTEGNIVLNSEVNDVVGGWTIGGDVSPYPSPIGQIADPLAGLPPPTPPSSPVHPCPAFSGPPGTLTLSPGVYECTIDPPGNWSIAFANGDYLLKGGIVMDGAGPVTFGSGIYTVRGGGMIVTGSGAVSGSEVMFYIDEGKLQMTGTGKVTLTPHTAGPYKGILFYQDRSNTNTIEMSGTAVANGSGALYAAGAEVDFTGTATTSMQFIVNTFYAHGTSNLTINYQDGFEAEVPRMRLFE
jgi:Flp pilus assembly protein TadG